MCRSIGSIGSVRLESQRTSDGTPARVHLDIETDDVPAEVARVVASAPLRRPHQAGDVFGRDKLTWELVRTLKRQPDMYRV